jgi:hypothetical protein
MPLASMKISTSGFNLSKKNKTKKTMVNILTGESYV